ncbi:hypothetical protein N7516_002574 [Penicillium verrucosum]|uniref:uncharacterized protein n=1 Tax=Penicillium verrucosum TaxID=60171 RepID=UPI00254542A9|nr:uncharacterized protein N7516_002574 [Penicillium verrucosum]KAJ5942406.1 hypothetical protein N7516_002574 [Penicillium verrucosum]
MEDRGGIEDRSGCNQCADCPEAVKPATVRLVGIELGGGSRGMKDRSGCNQSADCPEAEARHDQTVGIDVDERGRGSRMDE